jgi:hypothetical protein
MERYRQAKAAVIGPDAVADREPGDPLAHYGNGADQVAADDERERQVGSVGARADS